MSTIDRDRLVRAILPIFHHTHIKAPMRILLCDEVEKLAGLHNHLTEYMLIARCLLSLQLGTIAATAFIRNIFKQP